MPINFQKILAQAALNPSRCMTVDELALLLEPFSLPRRCAILYALETRISLSEAILLDWKSALKKATTDFATQLVKQQTRHLRLNYVFWEYLDDHIAAPLFGLDRSFPDFPIIQERYDNLIPIDREAERIHFMKALQAAR